MPTDHAAEQTTVMPCPRDEPSRLSVADALAARVPRDHRLLRRGLALSSVTAVS
jgi:hypothetical protein